MGKLHQKLWAARVAGKPYPVQDLQEGTNSKALEAHGNPLSSVPCRLYRNLALQIYSQKYPLKIRLTGFFCTSGLPPSQLPAESQERTPEAITNLEHLFMQLIFLEGKKAKTNIITK